jgi:predicted phosphodiesterase
MRIAIFSDIHGNPYSTRSVLAVICKWTSFDAVVAAGDICAGGSDPPGCVDLLGDMMYLAVYGNADESILKLAPCSFSAFSPDCKACFTIF